MSLLKCIVWLLLLSNVYSHQCRRTYTVSIECDVTYGIATKSINNVRSVTECSERCSGKDKCLSVKYDHEQQNCHLNDKRFRMLLTGVCSTMFKYASLVKRSCGKFMNEDCEDDSECSTDHSLCHEGKCKCKLGLSYNYGTESCVPSCDIYDNPFTSFKGFRIIETNVSYYRLSVSTNINCQSACVNEATFLCRSFTFDTKDFVCILHYYTINSAAVSFNADTYYNHRNCL